MSAAKQTPPVYHNCFILVFFITPGVHLYTFAGLAPQPPLPATIQRPAALNAPLFSSFLASPCSVFSRRFFGRLRLTAPWGPPPYRSNISLCRCLICQCASSEWNIFFMSAYFIIIYFSYCDFFGRLHTPTSTRSSPPTLAHTKIEPRKAGFADRSINFVLPLDLLIGFSSTAVLMWGATDVARCGFAFCV